MSSPKCVAACPFERIASLDNCIPIRDGSVVSMRSVFEQRPVLRK